jgi:3-hydroxybutyryl-CoA dehydrogenase
MATDAGPVLVVGDPPLAEELAALLREAGRPLTYCPVAPARAGGALPEADALARAAQEAALALETTVWPFERKRALVAALDAALPPTAVLASLCAAQSTSEIASWTARPQQVVGFSVVPPLSAGQLVEVAPGLDTAEAATAAVEQLFAAAGRETARVRDDAGLVLARILCLIINEAAAMVMEGVASPHDIDTALRLGANYPRGPLEWADLIGIDFVYAVLYGLQLEQGEDRYRPCPLLRKMVLAGRLGRKAGRGFFTYAQA